MPRPRSLTHHRIAAAALTVIDGEGLAALSMRAVAAELGMGTMSLYRYVKGREALERLVVDLVLAAVDLRLPTRAPWDKRVMILLERVRCAVSAHPSIMPLLLIHRHVTEGSMRFGEALLEVLAQAGFAGKRRAIAFRTLVSYLLGALQYQHLGPLSGAGTAALAELPRERYPRLAETARHAQRISPDEEFRGGLIVLVQGLHMKRSR